MYSKFYNIDKEKQDRIINAAMKEFRNKGYDAASTNEIVKECSISKGLLFHYFHNKKELFLFLFDYAQKTIQEDLFANIDWTENDFLAKYKNIAHLKLEVFHKYPEMFNFMKAAYFDTSSEIKPEIQKRSNEIVTNSYAKLYQNINFSMFKEDINPQKALHLISWALEGFSNQQEQKLKMLPKDQFGIKEVVDELDAYIEVLKKAFYK